MYYNILYNNRSSCNYLNSKYNNFNTSLCSNICNTNNNICNNNNNNNCANTDISNLHTKNDDKDIDIYNSINIDILQNINLSNIITNNNFNIYNCIYTYKYNKLVLLKNKNAKYGFLEIIIPTFTKNTDNLYILLNIDIDNKYSSNVKILNNEGVIDNFDLLKKKYFIESKYLNGTTENINKKYTISFESDICIFENLNIYFLGKLSTITEEQLDNSDKNDKLVTTKVNNSVTTYDNEQLKYKKNYVYNNNYNCIDKILFYNLKNPNILMNQGLWTTIVNKKKLFCISPKVPFFFDTSYEYYVQLNYYVSNGGYLDLKAFNDKKINSNPISNNISNENGVLIKKLDEFNNPFFYYTIYGLTSDDVVLKNLQIFYFVKDDTNDNSQDINNSCKNIKCTDDGIIISGSLTVS